ncbi:unnamed protein product, partial [Mesorhabditis spiculigera]
MVGVQDLSAVAALPNSYYGFVKDPFNSDSYLIHVEGRRYGDNFCQRLRATEMTLLERSPINHNIAKVVAFPLDKMGMSLIVAIGSAMTLMVYQADL